jgi:soluble lytic murein transglycosylase-like protein
LGQLLVALALLCPGRESLAEPMWREAHRHLIHPVLLAKTVAAESHCRLNAVNKRSGAIGLGQILHSGSANRGRYTVEQLRDPDLNLYLTARHLAWCLRLCKHRAAAAVAVYNGRSVCRSTEWSRWVVRGMWKAKLDARKAKLKRHRS